MIIDSSTMNLGSSRAYNSNMTITNTTKSTQLSTGITRFSSSTFQTAYGEISGQQLSNLYDSFQKSDTDLNSGNSENTPLASNLYSNLAKNNAPIENAKNSIQEFHNQLMQELEALMERIRNQLLGRGSLGSQTSSIMDLSTGGREPGSLWVRQDYQSYTYSETEVTTFNSTGTVKTADGRSIDFNVSMQMSRSFEETSEVLNESVEYLMTDPLVIHLSDAPESISDQTFLFDLDCDGNKEEMSALSKGSGFLALDLNDNGIIDDGSELFGTKSGNGFRDLAAYDEDGNGWIDENDSVYSKLKIWTKDENGRDVLTGLKNADVGAIYLGAAATQFSHNDLETNETKAMVRQTGIFLHESTGNAGTIQQIDFATKPAQEVA